MIEKLALAFLFVFSLHSFPAYTYDLHSSELLVPSPVFISTINSAIENVIIAQRKITIFANEFKDVGAASAINDCVELLDLTVDDLSASRSLIDNQTGDSCGTGNSNADLKAWLSAVIANQDTCIEGLEITSSSVKNEIVNILRKIQSQVSNLLGMVPDIASPIQFKKRKPLKNPTLDVVTVSKDGSGNFTSVMAAVLSAPNNSVNRFVIYVTEGVYAENVEIGNNKWNLIMIGDGMNKTVISGNRSVGPNMTTYATATFSVLGKGFMAQDITFENTAGPVKGQAVALRSNSDLSAFYKCAFLGFQDTLYVHSNRQFYKECVISGTVDFIFGRGSAVFQNCSIYVRNGQNFNTVTAHSRSSLNQTTGFTIQFSSFNSDIYNIACGTQSTYLGRPWAEFARTFVMQSYLDDIIQLEGWVEWNDRNSTGTVYYGEFMNEGPGAVLYGRVKWPGYHVMNKDEANKFTVKNLIDGDLWLPATGIEYTSGL
ncbi:pectinesterase [Ranunculus cassubicifolius]